MSRVRRLLAAWLLAWSAAVPGAASAFDHTHAAWSRLLGDHVAWNAAGTATAVDYAGFGRDRAALARYLQGLSAVTPAQYRGWTGDQRQAFLINAYNAATVELVLTRYPRLDSIRELGGLFGSPWKRQVLPLLGQQRSLDGIEHGLLRGAREYADPRIHFAVNCASIGCPALRPEAYVAARLDAQLDDQTRRFLRDRTRNRHDPGARTLHVSKLFDWYAADFDRHSGGVRRFLSRYRDELGVDAAGAAPAPPRIAFTAYDWRLNRRPR